MVDDGWLAVRDGCFIGRGEGVPPAALETLDARCQWVLPGVVDGQVHAGSQANQEGLGHASRAQLDANIAEVERDCHVDVALFSTLYDMYGLRCRV